ncbi:MAG: hypothetical protein KA732_11595 [Providencia sp.]|uniref:hypothetical protein n=1 Tax=Providencia sp. TaxID=589 RepID=UPI001B59CFDE|nr:hypothetical protein [Providencia sp.]MBP6081903.1 hypothetical protein [Providencia sp.]
MIKVSKNDAFNNNFILKYKSLVRDFVLQEKSGFVFFHHSFEFNDLLNSDLIYHIAYDPFSSNGSSKCHSFLIDYQQISQFLLYGNSYLNIIKKQIKNRIGADYRKVLLDERKSIINNFNKNLILIKLGINDPKIIKNESNFLEFHKKIKDKFNDNNKKIKKIFNYNEFLNSKENIRSEILGNNKIKVCPYCNRQYIDTYSHQGKIKSIAQIDHYFPKSIFPLYSLTLLNFIPSCSHCNCIIKKDKLFPWSPIYVDKLENQKYFEINFNGTSGLYGDANSFKLEVTPKTKSESNNSYFFRHQEIYKNHKEDVSILLKKRQIFNDGYRNSIKTIIGNNMSDEEFKFMIFGVTGNDSDHLTNPLSKLKNDIVKGFE